MLFYVDVVVVLCCPLKDYWLLVEDELLACAFGATFNELDILKDYRVSWSQVQILEFFLAKNRGSILIAVLAKRF